uniref:E3 UFM1-protein ligase 1 homolog n=1 Tax=Drosophila pseudoobscura pseudoobscura TaxID=46245 RepID=UFL1_DROPS|nr:RecName: Full=E3 UFM1-protein ligase 1 homolog; AltName: Full=E3 UFM1-protein transferase 1 homolog [Drosophila pseudoobscura pseudoobscura]
MGSDWDEIKRLAADFQKAQLTSTLQKLSERNCVEIVTLLLEKQLLEVVFTNNGKEYITPDHLEREIQDELYANGGRANLVEVSRTLNVDLSRIVALAERIAAENPLVHLVLGQLIDEDYISHIAQEINEKLALRGEISISDLASQFDLPSEFLQQDVVEKHLGKIIKGRQDATNPRVFFTQAYIQRCKAKIRGALAAITRPTNVAVILQQINVQEKIFHSLLDEISPAGQVTSKLANAQYVPHIYAKTQADWVNSFYKQNSFLEYDAINKLGISDAKSYIRKQFPNEEFLFLKRVALGARLVELTVVTALNECSATKQYLDLTTILPSNLSEEDIEEVFSAIMAQKHSNPSNFVYLDSIVFSQPYLTELVQPCHALAEAQAKAAIDSGVYQQFVVEKTLAQKGNASFQDQDDDGKLDKRDERRKKASSGKAGGGAQGRETKTKSTKKHQRRSAAAQNDSDDEDDVQHQGSRGAGGGGGNKKTVKPLDLVKTADIEKLINASLQEEGLEHLAPSIAALYLNQLNQAALAKAQELYEATPQTNRRQTHAAIQDRINTLLIDIRLYEKGLKLFSHDTQTQLVKYLLKSLGNDICNELSLYVASECNLTVKNTSLNVDQRIKLAQECDAEYRSALLEQNKALNKSIDDFELATESVLKACSMIIKKVDKKKDRLLIADHKNKLQQQLLDCQEPALLLHLAALILFTTISGCILHASGKFVSAILQHIRGSLSDQQNDMLLRYHDLVLQVLQTAPESDDSKIAHEQLQIMQSKVVELAQNYTRASVSKAD